MIRKQHLNRRFGSILPRDKGKRLLTKCLHGIFRSSYVQYKSVPHVFLQSKITSDLTLAYI